MSHLELKCAGNELVADKISWEDRDQDNFPQKKEVLYEGKPISEAFYQCYLELKNLKSGQVSSSGHVVFDNLEGLLPEGAVEKISAHPLVRRARMVRVWADPLKRKLYISVTARNGKKTDGSSHIMPADQLVPNDGFGMYHVNVALQWLERNVRLRKASQIEFKRTGNWMPGDLSDQAEEKFYRNRLILNADRIQVVFGVGSLMVVVEKANKVFESSLYFDPHIAASNGHVVEVEAALRSLRRVSGARKDVCDDSGPVAVGR